MVQRTVFRRRGNQVQINTGPDFGDGANHFGRRRYRKYNMEPRATTTPIDGPRTTIVPPRLEIEYVLPTSADDVIYVVLWLKRSLEETGLSTLIRHIKRRIFILDKMKCLLLIENITLADFPRLHFPMNRYKRFEYRAQELPFEIPPEPYTP